MSDSSNCIVRHRYLITSALPYINGVKHLGNLIGSMLSADVYARYLRQQGEEVLYICGTDEHGTPAEIAALQEGMSVQDYTNRMYDIQRSVYERFQISFDYFGRTSSPLHHAWTHHVFQALQAHQLTSTQIIAQMYSEFDQRFLPDRYIIGTCPHCQYDKARGDQCDGCGALLSGTDLLHPRSSISQSNQLVQKKVEHLFLDLPAMAESLKQWIQSRSFAPHVKHMALGWIQEGLQPRCISRDLTWGVSIPHPSHQHQVFYVWFDAPIGYMSLTESWAQSIHQPNAWRSWWLLDEALPQTQVHYVQFMAKDNVPFHSIFFPAMILGSRLPIRLVDTIKAFHWLHYEGGKFSTSQKRGVFLDDALDLFPSDYWRYYLIAQAPESADVQFTFEDFASRINHELANTIGNFVARITQLASQHNESMHPPIPTDQTFQTLQTECQKRLELLDQSMRHIELRSSMRIIKGLWDLCNEYVTQQAPWKEKDLKKKSDAIALSLYLLRVATLASHPFIPNLTITIGEAIGLTDFQQSKERIIDYPIDHSKTRIRVLKGLISKITDDTIASLKQRFSGEADSSSVE